MSLSQTQISQLYVSLFGRASEGEGNNYWQQFDSLSEVISLMLDLDVVKEYFGSTLNNNKSFVEFIYENTLGKTYSEDAEGIDYWVSLLDKNVSKNEIIERIIEASQLEVNAGEAQDQFNNRVEVSNYISDLIYKVPNDYTNTLSFNTMGVTNSIESVENAKTYAQEKFISSTTIFSIELSEGVFTYGSSIFVDVNFDNDINLNGTNIELKLNITELTKIAKMYAYDKRSITFEYIVEDGYFSSESKIAIGENAFLTNSIELKDNDGLDINLNNESISFDNSTIIDTYAPIYKVHNINYDSKTNTLSINGEGFSSILEYDENSSSDILDRIDFSKLIWDIDSDDLNTSSSIFTFSNTNISNVKIVNDNNLELILSNEITLENEIGYGNDLVADSIDIEEGFLIDKAGNISNVASINDIILGIDNNILGTASFDILHGTKSSDTITSSTGDDTIYGYEGNDIILGNSGNNYISGGKGIDKITGGDGNNTYFFSLGDSLPLFETNFGIDYISDLKINNKEKDLIALDKKVDQINTQIYSELNKNSFISDLNSNLNFNNLTDVEVYMVNASKGDLQGKEYLYIDYNENNTVDINDLVIEVTGSLIDDITIDSFILINA